MTFDNLPIPLAMDSHGIARIGGTRVTLDTVVGAFQRGATAEEIVQDYSSLRLADVYVAIAFYLHNRAAVDTYIEEQQKRGDEIQRRIEAKSDPAEFRQRLLNRRKETA